MVSGLLVGVRLSCPALAAGTPIDIPEEGVTPGVTVEFKSVDDETGTYDAGLPGIQTRVAPGKIIWKEKSMRGGTKYIEQAVSTREGSRTAEFASVG